MKILVVDDDLELLGLVSFALRQAGYFALEAADGPKALEAFSREQPDLVILDVNLPGLSGFEVCRRIREQASTPIMMLTVRSSEEDEVKGLDLGADDYLTKPFELPEVVARCRALIRRSKAAVATEFVHGNLTVDVRRHKALLSGQPVDLTAREWAVLEYLLLHSQEVVSKERLLHAISSWDKEITPNAVEVYVSRLRAKLEPGDVRIRTIRGLGYRLEDPVT
jgi:DNA-binding response OmpR family regulator